MCGRAGFQMKQNDDDFLREPADDDLLPDDELIGFQPEPDAEKDSGSLNFGVPGETVYRTVEDFQSGWRLDQFLVHHFPQYSRTLLRKVISAEGVTVDGKHGKPSFRLKPGQSVSFVLQEIPRESPVPEEIPLDVLFEDDDLAVINKPADMVVHPSRGHWAGTLVSALAFRYAGHLSSVRGPARPGVVHRLDRDTSGAILVAKNDIIHAKLAALFENRQIHKEYFGIVLGVPAVDRDIVDQPIGHHPRQKEKMMIAKDDPDAKPATTFFEVMERFRGFSTVRACPKTGRTHQIRVHLAYYGCPILCDKLYGGRSGITMGEIAGKYDSREEEFTRIVLGRQALHAFRISFVHPNTGKELAIEAPLPPDMTETLEALRRWRSV